MRLISYISRFHGWQAKVTVHTNRAHEGCLMRFVRFVSFVVELPPRLGHNRLGVGKQHVIVIVVNQQERQHRDVVWLGL